MRLSEIGPGKKRRFYFFLIILLTFSVVWVARRSSDQAPPSEEIILATTTSLDDSGLLDQLLAAFEKQSEIKVKPIAVGSGEALKMGERGEADLLLVHSPELEKQFMANNYGLRRQELMTSKFVLLGPAEDSAKIRNLPFSEALARIAHAKSFFLSRADNSGTHLLEKKIWAELALRPSGDWYLESGQGMAEALMIASEKRAYLLADYPTYYRLKSKINLVVLGTDENYPNIYSVILPKPKRERGNEAGATQLFEFLLSPKVKEIIASFGLEEGQNEPLFQPMQNKSNGLTENE